MPTLVSQNLHFIRNLQRDIILRKNVLALKIIDSLELNLLIWPSHLLSLQALIDIAKGAGWPNTKGTKKQSEQHVLTQIPDALSATVVCTKRIRPYLEPSLEDRWPLFARN